MTLTALTPLLAALLAAMSEQVLLDTGRRGRIGLDEAVLCQDKTAAQIGAILASGEGRVRSLLLTRLSPETYAALPDRFRGALDYDPPSQTAIWGQSEPPIVTARVAVVTAGTSDYGVAREAVRTLGFHGEAANEVHDVGVAGLWRLMDRLEEVRRHPVVIVAAGMDGALFSVIGGLMAGVVIALPTPAASYGVGGGGRVALETALVSCAPGVAVVNIGNGYGAACVALRVLRAVSRSD